MNSRFLIGGLIALLLSLPLLAAAADGELKALVGGTLISGLGEPPLQDSVVLVRGDRIERIGTVASLPVPDGYEVISTEGMSVLPGLWDMHVHLDINGHADYEHWHPTYRDRFADEIMPASAVQLGRGHDRPRPGRSAGSLAVRPRSGRRRRVARTTAVHLGSVPAARALSGYRGLPLGARQPP